MKRIASLALKVIYRDHLGYMAEIYSVIYKPSDLARY